MRRRTHILLLISSILCCVTPVASQSAYRFQNYSINHGLSQSSVLCMIQDDNYSLWIGTQDGLNRFDGRNFEVFTSEDVEGLESSYIRSAIKRKDGTLWFGTANGLTRYKPNTNTFKTYSHSGTAFSIEKIAEDGGQNIWIATTSRGVWKFDVHKKTFASQVNIFPTRRAKNVFVSSENVVFVVSDDYQLEAYYPKTEQRKTVSFQSKNGTPVVVQSIVQFRPDEVILGTNQGVYKCVISTLRTAPLFTELDRQFGYMGVSSIVASTDGHWYIGTTNNGLFTVHEDGTVFNSTQDIFQKNALLFNEISCIYEDKGGTFWIGTARGISSFDPGNQGFLGIGPSGNLEQGIPTPTVWSFAEDAKGEYIFVGTDIGISRLHRKTGKFDQFYKQKNLAITGEASENAVLGMVVLSQNHVLVAGVDGLFELHIRGKNDYDFKPVRFIEGTISEDHRRAYRIVPYKDNTYFVATKSGVLLVDFASKSVKEFVHQSMKPTKSIRPGICRLIYKDRSGRYFFATSSGGLSVLDETNPDQLVIRPYIHNDKLQAAITGYITAIVETRSGEFWFGTLGNGIARWNEASGKLQLFGKESGLPNNVIYALRTDVRGKLWLSTNKGLCCFDPKTKETINFTEIHGLMSNEFNLGADLKSISGELFFGGISGFNYFDPVAVTKSNPRVSVVLSKFRLDKNWLNPNEKGSPLKKPIWEVDQIDLTYRQNSFTIRFQPSNLSNPDLVNYKYVLEGSGEGVTEIGSTNELRFSSLSFGDYTLKIYARIGQGAWVSEPTVLKISIAAPFWARWWFWVLMAALLFVLIRFSIRKRIDYERREQVRLEMKIAQRTREIREQKIKIEKQKKEIEKKKEKVERQRKQLQIEKEKSERLLRNVIPDTMADELLATGEASARAFKVVSVMFTDFVGFTKIADRTDPTELVKKLDVFFRKFDEIVFSNNLEKIKTIGDAYMCAGGVPVRNNTNPIDACLAGLQIQHYMAELQKEAEDAEEEYWTLRLGINTGEVTAGVIGSKRLAYDVWGTTVNQAQRMEMLGEPGKVTITRNTYLHIEPYFECTYKGQVQSKSRGKIQMYQVERIKPELSVDGQGIFPNERFHQIVNLHHYSSINYYKAERFIMKTLEDRLSEKLHYHSIAHTRDVVQAVERLALNENVTDEGLFLLKTAATYHDAGFVEQYEKNEPIGARLAAEILPKYGYTDEHIEKVKELIYVTAIPHQPKNNLEEIICDADLDYLGRDDFHEIADRLRRELKEHGKIDSDRKWDEIQVSFLTQHRYFTKTAIATRQEKKMKNLEEIKARLERGEYAD